MYVYKLQEIAMTTAPLITLGCIMMSFSSWVLWFGAIFHQTKQGVEKLCWLRGTPYQGHVIAEQTPIVQGLKYLFQFHLGEL